MALNEPRTIPYEFKVFEFDGWVWLYDNSERTYCCSSTPSVFAEPLYQLSTVDNPEPDDPYPDSGYYNASDIVRRNPVAVDIDREYTAFDVSAQEAWDTAREEAQANHLL